MLSVEFLLTNILLKMYKHRGNKLLLAPLLY